MNTVTVAGKALPSPASIRRSAAYGKTSARPSPRPSSRTFVFHNLRHSLAPRMLRRSQNLKFVSRLAGHSSVETTMRYAM
ncbi:site-specific integrase [Paracoccus sp. 22332]|uniref:site-specific integrase n=1 Tax=Paracoccus sp. 22332 TaxID=3453913 RepID=UPI003F845494